MLNIPRERVTAPTLSSASVLQEGQKTRIFTPVREPSGESRIIVLFKFFRSALGPIDTRGVAAILGIFLLFLGTAELRLGRASCEIIVDRMQRGFCLEKQIDIDTASKPLADRITQYKIASDNLPDHYLLLLKLAEAYAANGDKRAALPLFDRAESLIRRQQPEMADLILEEKASVLHSIESPR